MKGINLNQLIQNIQTGQEKNQKSSFIDYNLNKTEDSFSNYLNTINKPEQQTFQNKNQNEFKSEANEAHNNNVRSESPANDEKVEIKDDFSKNKIDQASKKETLDDKIEAVKKEIAREIEKEDKLKETKEEVKDKINALLSILDQLIKAKTNKDAKLGKELDSRIAELKVILEKLDKLDFTNKNDEKELTSLLKALSKIIDKDQMASAKLSELFDKANLSKDKELPLKEIIKDLKKIIEENPEKIVKSEKPKIEKVELDNKPIKEGIQLVHTKESNVRAERVKESAKQDNQNNESLNVQKSEAKVNSSTENGESSRSDLFNSDSKSSLFTKNLKVAKGSQIKNPDQLFNQIVSKAKMLVNNERSEMRIQLEPKLLGQTNIRVIVEKGMVTGHFAVENQAVKAFLEDNLQSLKDSLQAQGLEVDQIDISLTDKDAGQSQAEKGQERLELMKQFGKNKNENTDNLNMSEDLLDNRYRSPEWMAKEVDVQI